MKRNRLRKNRRLITYDMSKKGILVIGSSNTDMTVKTKELPRPGETVLGGVFTMGAGGKGANQAVAAQRLGGNVKFICKVGKDIFGDNSIAQYKKEGLDVSGILRSDQPSGVALISVGAATEVEMKEAKMRIEDALAATRAAVEEGIVAGGGVALLNVTKQVEALKARTTGDEKTGVDIVLRTLEAPMRQIAKNAGEEGSVIVENIKRSKKIGYGFDAADNTYGDMLHKGIIDPTKVTRCAPQNAASVAAMVLTTESLVCDIPKPEPAAPAPGMGGGDMY